MYHLELPPGAYEVNILQLSYTKEGAANELAKIILKPIQKYYKTLKLLMFDETDQNMY
jgi:hypothetical protein